MNAVFLLLHAVGMVRGAAGIGLEDSGVYLTISSFNGPRRHGYFEINWYGIDHEYGGNLVAALSRKYPPTCASDLLFLCAVTRPSGACSTSIKAPQFELKTLMEGECLGYWAVILHETARGAVDVLHSSCLTPRTRWMRENCCELSSLSLRELLIPGTHNSAMYHSGHTLPHERLIYNQEIGIAEQLAYGVRSFDLRVQYGRREFYITHHRIRGPLTVREVLKTVRDFVVATGELVLLDFHRFTKGFNPKSPNAKSRHENLVKLIVAELRDVILPGHFWQREMGKLLGECSQERNQTGHVLVFYNADFKGFGHTYLAPGIKHRWPNARSSYDLIKYLETTACVPEQGRMTSIMAELTPSFPEFLVDIRRAAQWVNHRVTEFFREKCWNCSAIVATDFFLGNGVIDVAVEANIMRGRQKNLRQLLYC